MPIFIALFFVCFLLGCGLFVVQDKQKVLFPFLLLVFLFPSPEYFGRIIFNYQIFYWYGFLGPAFLYVLLARIKSSVRVTSYSYFIIFFLSFYLIYSILFLGRKINVNFLVDVKILVLLFLTIWIAELVNKKSSNLFQSRAWGRALFLNFILDTTGILLSAFYALPKYFTNDSHFLTEYSTRYSDFSIPFLVGYFVYLLANRKGEKVPLWHYLATILPVLYSGNRTIIVFGLVITGIQFAIRILSGKLSIIKLAAGIALPLILLLAFSIVNFDTKRYEDLLSQEVLIEKLTIRYSPYFDAVESHGGVEQVLGGGLGQSFHIPWFEYRKKIRNKNNYMDNLWFTIFAKYRYLGLILIALFFIIPFRFCDKSEAILYSLLVLGMFLTTAFFYQGAFPLFVFVLPFITKKYKSIPPAIEAQHQST